MDRDCDYSVEVTLPDGRTETLHCVSRIRDGEHVIESHKMTLFVEVAE